MAGEADQEQGVRAQRGGDVKGPDGLGRSGSGHGPSLL